MAGHDRAKELPVLRGQTHVVSGLSRKPRAASPEAPAEHYILGAGAFGSSLLRRNITVATAA